MHPCRMHETVHWRRCYDRLLTRKEVDWPRKRAREQPEACLDCSQADRGRHRHCSGRSEAAELDWTGDRGGASLRRRRTPQAPVAWRDWKQTLRDHRESEEDES